MIAVSNALRSRGHRITFFLLGVPPVGESTELVCGDRLRAKKRRDARPGYTAENQGLDLDADGQAKFRATPEEQQEEREPVRDLLQE